MAEEATEKTADAIESITLLQKAYLMLITKLQMKCLKTNKAP